MTTNEAKKFYITTPIYYPSGSLHIGHAYTTVAADTMARYKKMRGYDTYFLTGTDEHGQKIQQRADAAGVDPLSFVDGIVADIKALWQLLDVQYDDFIRTTEPRHKEVAQKIFTRIYEKGDIYKSEYSGWYCTPCETFFTERQLLEGGLCPDCGRPVELMKEESYFFNMKKYADKWLQYIEDHPDFIKPETRKNEMVSFVKQGLEDLCVSRTTFDWGIKVPQDPKHVMYVWFDALVNYVSAIGYLTEDDSKYQKYWPADVHLMAKDIIRFHAIIWPIILMAADMPIPHQVVAHGWLLMNDGKMSKSKGNVVDPNVLVEKYGVDPIRYFLLREMVFGQDANYSEESLVSRINVDLANDYGNLLSRTTSMIDKFQGGSVNASTVGTEFDASLIETMQTAKAEFATNMDKMDINSALVCLWKLVNRANKYIDEVAPWALNKAGETEKLNTVLYNLVETIRITTIIVAPVMPSIGEKVWAQLGISESASEQTWDNAIYGKYPLNTKINRGEPLFPRIDPATLIVPEVAEEVVEEVAEVTFEPAKPEITIDDFNKIDLRVAKVIACEKVKKADKLLKFDLEVAGEMRTVVSGIAQWHNPEEMVGKQVIVVANLKPVKLRGIESQGMILSASLGGELRVVEVNEVVSNGGTVC